MDRLLVVRCPGLLREDEGGSVMRSFVRVVEAVEEYCPWVTAVRPGICSLPARGPARYFGGEGALVRLVADAATAAVPGVDVEIGIADGLFAAVRAARDGLVVPAGGTPDFLAPLPLDVLGSPELTGLLARLGIRTLGELAALPEPHVLGRFGADGVSCHRVAAGRSDELAGLREPGTGRRVDELRGRATPTTVTTPTPTVRQSGFWGGASDADARAVRSLAAVQRRLGADGVVVARLQGGRSPAEQLRYVTWDTREAPADAAPGAPWPGRIPPPAPALVHLAPVPAELAGADGEPVTVSGRGLLATPPARLSVAGGAWTAVTAWAGPWPVEERWWSRSRRRSARMQVVTGDDARLLLAERGRWWVEATYG